MSLLATKSWNPRSGKNRARVERDEAELKEAEQKLSDRSQQSESEWTYDRLKRSSVRGAAVVIGEAPSSPVLASEMDKLVENPSIDDSDVGKSRKVPKGSVPNGNPLGGVTRPMKAWYEYEEYILPINKVVSKSEARDVHRQDPLTLMSELERKQKAGGSVSVAGGRVKARSSPYDGIESGKSLVQKLREERLQREQYEKEKAMKLLGHSGAVRGKARAVRYGALRGDA